MVYPDSKYTNPLKRGQNFEDFVSITLARRLGIKVTLFRTCSEQYAIGESAEGYEIKEDVHCTRTRRLSIEVGEKTAARQFSFIPSGIMRQDNTVWYVQGNRTCLWVFRKRDLQALYISSIPLIIDNNPPTIQKFYLPIDEANRMAAHVLRITPDICQYSLPPYPDWSNCMPCPLYQNGHCANTPAA